MENLHAQNADTDSASNEEWICPECGSNEGAPGTVLDPFMGAGTTALVARKLNRNFIGFELNPEYIKIAENRMINELGMFF